LGEEKKEDINFFEKTINIVFNINKGEENVIKNCLEGYDIINYIQKTYKNNSIDENITKKRENSAKPYNSGCGLCSYLSLISVIGLGNEDDFLIRLLWRGIVKNMQFVD
jgi:tRNA A-37 threonylcarbamoyl transferase component Bud32